MQLHNQQMCLQVLQLLHSIKLCMLFLMSLLICKTCNVIFLFNFPFYNQSCSVASCFNLALFLNFLSLKSKKSFVFQVQAEHIFTSCNIQECNSDLSSWVENEQRIQAWGVILTWPSTWIWSNSSEFLRNSFHSQKLHLILDTEC